MGKDDIKTIDVTDDEVALEPTDDDEEPVEEQVVDSKGKVRVKLDYQSHFKGLLYKPGEYDVEPGIAKRLAEINRMLVKENK